MVRLRSLGETLADGNPRFPMLESNLQEQRVDSKARVPLPLVQATRVRFPMHNHEFLADEALDSERVSLLFLP